MINTEQGTGLVWAACDECGRPFDVSGLFNAFKTPHIEVLIASAREHAWWYSDERHIVLCPAHAWLAPSTGLRVDADRPQSGTAR